MFVSWPASMILPATCSRQLVMLLGLVHVILAEGPPPAPAYPSYPPAPVQQLSAPPYPPPPAGPKPMMIVSPRNGQCLSQGPSIMAGVYVLAMRACRVGAASLDQLWSMLPQPDGSDILENGIRACPVQEGLAADSAVLMTHDCVTDKQKLGCWSLWDQFDQTVEEPEYHREVLIHVHDCSRPADSLLCVAKVAQSSEVQVEPCNTTNANQYWVWTANRNLKSPPDRRTSPRRPPSPAQPPSPPFPPSVPSPPPNIPPPSYPPKPPYPPNWKDLLPPKYNGHSNVRHPPHSSPAPPVYPSPPPAYPDMPAYPPNEPSPPPMPPKPPRPPRSPPPRRACPVIRGFVRQPGFDLDPLALPSGVVLAGTPRQELVAMCAPQPQCLAFSTTAGAMLTSLQHLCYNLSSPRGGCSGMWFRSNLTLPQAPLCTAVGGYEWALGGILAPACNWLNANLGQAALAQQEIARLAANCSANSSCLAFDIVGEMVMTAQDLLARLVKCRGVFVKDYGPTPSPPSATGSSTNVVAIVVPAVVGGVVFLTAVAAVLVVWCRRRRRSAAGQSSVDGGVKPDAAGRISGSSGDATGGGGGAGRLSGAASIDHLLRSCMGQDPSSKDASKDLPDGSSPGGIAIGVPGKASFDNNSLPTLPENRSFASLPAHLSFDSEGKGASNSMPSVSIQIAADAATDAPYPPLMDSARTHASGKSPVRRDAAIASATHSLVSPLDMYGSETTCSTTLTDVTGGTTSGTASGYSTGAQGLDAQLLEAYRKLSVLDLDADRCNRLRSSSLQRLPQGVSGRALAVPPAVAPSPFGAANAAAALFEADLTPLQVDGGLLDNPDRVRLDLDWVKDVIVHADQVLGHGAMGIVYRGSYQGRTVAVKTLKSVICGELDEDAENFILEVQIMARLHHQNVVELYGGCLVPPQIFLVEELMVGSLADILRPGRPMLPLSKVFKLAADILCGLSYLHSLDVLHRDLKPANILLDAGGMAKISDFGLARGKYKTYLSTKNMDAGTVAYMAPECFDPTVGGVTTKADVYSFGVLLWELLSMKRPWEGDSHVTIIYRVAIQNKRPPIHDCAPARFPARLVRLVQSCWAHLSADRPDSAAALTELKDIEGELGLDSQ